MKVSLIYPRARPALLGKQTQPKMTAHDILCWHTMVGYLTSTDGYFRVTNGPGFDGTESHWGIGGKWGPDVGGHMDGKVFQWQDAMYSADANLDGNGRVLSIENADNAARPIQPLTPAQLQAGIELGTWVCDVRTHAGCPTNWACRRMGIPAVMIPDTRPGRRGIAVHAQGSRDRVAGGERWSTTMTKDCPTDVRIGQVKNIIIPGIRARLAGGGDWFDMATEDQLAKVVRGVLHLPDTGLKPPHGQIHNGNLADMLVGAAQGASNALRRVEGAIAAVRSDTRVTGDDEAHVLTALQAVEKRLTALLGDDTGT